ncbi:MAG: 4-hydroxy-tetrahydrodipicolinate reductase [Bacteroidales bacterium]|nr:4-hydroxy-tetrahydrodipicolinate reductase [Bacteroidales bacterium]
MKIAIVGYGKMGKAIEEIAVSRGHSIVCKIDINETGRFDSPEFESADVAIEFTTPQSAFDNYLKCFAHNVPVVSGSTGWTDRIGEIRDMCAGGKQTFLWSSNFSLGVNIFAEVNRHLAKIMNSYNDNYKVSMSETHHIHKLDAPSGTAITLAEGIIENNDRLNGWTLAPEKRDDAVQITAFREGEVPGIHSIKYESEFDTIEITHNAKTRRGFAFGAVLAAEYAHDKKGFLNISDVFAF